ncbi:MAG: peptide chain release factor N(5)-glutamine methyltransferase [Polyangiaceae bacterium]
MTEPWTIGRVLAWARDDLKGRGSASPRLDAELMLAQILECDRIKLITDSGRPLQDSELAAYRQLHKRRRRGEPVAYLRGFREFFGRSFRVDTRVLVPRPETEILVEVALKRSRRVSLCARILDVCTGSGCVAITLAKERPTTRVTGSDISSEALEIARDNMHRLGGRVSFVRSDLVEAFAGRRDRFDLVTANPPYINDEDMTKLPVDIRDFEPAVALSAGPDGLRLIRRLIAEVPAVLAAAGVLAMEIGAGQAEQVRTLFEAGGFTDIETSLDYQGHERIVSAKLDAQGRGTE